jgi:hypothetical protein
MEVAMDMLILAIQLHERMNRFPDSRRCILSLAAGFGMLAFVVTALEIASSRGAAQPFPGEALSARPETTALDQPARPEAGRSFRQTSELP